MKGYRVLVTIAALALVSASCLRPPSLPSWDVSVTLPLYRSTLRLPDLLDSARFRAEPDSTIGFSYRFQVDTVRPDGVIDLLSVSEMSRLALSDFVFCAIPKGRVPTGLDELLGYPIPDTGLKQRVEPFVTTQERSCDIPTFESAEILEAVVRTTLCNNTGLPFDSLTVDLPSGRVRFERIMPRTTQSAQTSISGIRLESPLAMTIIAGSPGTGHDTVRLSKSDSVTVEVAIDSVRLTNARLTIPSAQGRCRCQVAVGSSQPFRIDSLMLLAGSCDIALKNDFNVPILARLAVSKLGQSLERRLPAKSTDRVELSLIGTRLDNRSKTNSLFNFEVVAVPEPSRDPIDLTKADGVSVSCGTRGLRAQYIAGEFQEPVYAVSVLETLPPLVPFGVRGARVAHADLILDFETGIGFPLAVQLQMTALRDSEAVARIDREVLIPAGDFCNPKTETCVLPATELVNAAPDFMVLEYTIRLTGRGSHSLGAWLTGRGMLVSPMRAAFVPDTVTTGKKQLTLGESLYSKIAEHLLGGEAAISLSNRMPIGFAGRLCVRADSSAAPNPLALVDSVVLPFGVSAGPVDVDGNCVGKSDTVVTVQLDSIEATIFRRNPLATHVTFELPESDTVTFRTTDCMDIDAIVELRLRVEE